MKIHLVDKMIKAIFIDIDDTILDWHLCSHQAASIAAKKLNILLPSNFFDVLDEVNQDLWDRYDRKEIDFETIKAIRFKTIFEKTNIIANPIEFEAKFREGVRDSTIEVEGARDLLEYLYSKYYVFAASNSNLYQQVRRLSRGALLDYFNDLFISEDIGHRKPSKEFFIECIKRSHFEPNEIIVIGDSLTTDIQGANNANLKSIWYNPKRKEVNHSATYMVYDLNEIKKIL